MPVYNKDTEAVEIELPDSRPVASAQNRNEGISVAKAVALPKQEPAAAGLSQAKSPSSESPSADRPARGEKTYKPACRLIDSVKITPWHTDYSYYEQFCAQALKLRDYTADACPELPFFSYMPQYSQMTPGQLSYYLYIRNEIREGRYPHADYSYLLLTVYETINLSAVTPADESLEMLANLYTGYRQEHERLAVQLSDWICDFCLVNCCPLPDKLLPYIPVLAKDSYLKEFYIGSGKGDFGPGELLRWVSAYDYTKSRFARDGKREFYDRHMSGVLTAVMKDCPRIFESSSFEKHTVTRDAYVGALCSPRIKKRMEIVSFSFSKSHELHFLVSDILKYSENRIRGAIGVKSRLSHGKLPPAVQKAAEAYFASQPDFSHSRQGDIPAYEKLYEPRDTVLSFESAAAIEASSWQTTGKLVSAFADEQEPADTNDTGAPAGKDENIPESSAETAEITSKQELSQNIPASAETAEGFWAALDDIQRAFVLAVLKNDRPGQKKVAALAGLDITLMADAVNGIAADTIEDIILENTDGSWAVIEDYLDEIPEGEQ